MNDSNSTDLRLRAVKWLHDHGAHLVRLEPDSSGNLKKPFVPNWQHDPTSLNDCISDIRRGGKLGLIAASIRLLCLDIDVSDKELSDRIKQALIAKCAPLIAIPSLSPNRWHCYYRWSGSDLKCKKVKVPGGQVEIRHVDVQTVLHDPVALWQSAIGNKGGHADEVFIAWIRRGCRDQPKRKTQRATKAQNWQTDALDRIAKASVGERNDTLNKVIHAAGRRNVDLRQDARRIALQAGLPASEVDATIKGAWSAGQANPIANGKGTQGESAKPERLNAVQTASYLYQQTPSDALRVIGQGWYIKDRSLWIHAPDDALMRARIKPELKRLHDTEGLIARGLRTRDVVDELKSDYLVENFNLMDSNNFACGLRNGEFINLKTGETRQAKPSPDQTQSTSEYISKRLGVIPKRGVLTHWNQLLNHICANSESEKIWLRKALGYCLTGETRQEIFLFIVGAAGGGKTALIETVKAIAGEYAGGINGKHLVTKQHDHLEYLARLVGKRIAIVSDLRAGTWETHDIKALTSGDTITARYMRESSFEYQSQTKILISANKKPRFADSDSGFMRRMVLIPVEPVARVDLQFKDKLKLERAAIAADLIAAASEYIGNGLGEIPKRWQQAAKEYERDEDLLQQWFDHRFRYDPMAKSAFIPNHELIASYNAYHTDLPDIRNIRPIKRWIEGKWGRKLFRHTGNERGFNFIVPYER